ncbi:zinc-ribbon domain-containing protein [Phreatobacter sp. AB_2022a]|uniref:zinc-ribbon domain-containing protein n=1 Tax=Phreatobacter sp. AB_2022a TaxID=3003134 RepID=UPI002287465D|nr:zinc-ribbon domain-containing protein [Phreatobacter sp. AB_2022a]MCZ0732664.1 zinc-ribbon domain-containing protein [Phreatobacter sp. AB_2022a]
MSFFKHLLGGGRHGRQSRHHGGYGYGPTTTGSPAAAILCPACAAQNTTGSRFCGQCGTALGTRPCPSCSTERPASAKFCPQCGAAG